MARQRGRTSISTQMVIGAIIVLVGIVLLLETTDVYDAGYLFRYVPSLFVVLGLFLMVRSRFRNVFGPLIVIVVAGVWQLTALDVISRADVWDFWPLLIVLFGLSLVFAHFRRQPTGVSASHVTAFAMFGGSEKRSTAADFEGADLTALFGGTELDLRDAGIGELPAHISANAMFGGVEIIVPREWNVQIDVVPLFGGASDERPRRDDEHDSVDLVVTGLALFGGVTVKD